MPDCGIQFIAAAQNSGQTDSEWPTPETSPLLPLSWRGNGRKIQLLQADCHGNIESQTKYWGVESDIPEIVANQHS